MTTLSWHEYTCESVTNIKDRVLSFPEKIEYEGMVQLSHIAFVPGRLIHTNEFLVDSKRLHLHFGIDVDADYQEENLEEAKNKKERNRQAEDKLNQQWLSHRETASALEAYLSKILQSKGEHQRHTNVYTLDAKNKDVNVEVNDNEDENIETNEDENIETNENSNFENIFEIREYFDSDGCEISRDIINVTSQLHEMELILSKRSENAKSKVKKEKGCNNVDKNHRKPKDLIEVSEVELGSINKTNSDSGGAIESSALHDEHFALTRELAATRAVDVDNNHHVVESKFDCKLQNNCWTKGFLEKKRKYIPQNKTISSSPLPTSSASISPSRTSLMSQSQILIQNHGQVPFKEHVRERHPKPPSPLTNFCQRK